MKATEENDLVPPINLTPEKLFLESDFLVHLSSACSDESVLNKPGICVGTHMYCGGHVYRYRSSATTDILVCKQCYLRIHFPKDVQTYGKLRMALALRG